MAPETPAAGDLELLRRFEPVLCFSGEDYEERFLPLPVESFLADCRLFSGRPGRLGKGRELTTAWDAAAPHEGSDPERGQARAQVLGLPNLDGVDLGRRAFLVAIASDAAKRAARLSSADPEASLRGAIGPLAIGVLLLAGAGFGATRERPILFWTLTVLGVLLLVGAGLEILRARVGREQATSLWSDFVALASLLGAWLAWRDGSPGTAAVLGLLGGLALTAQLFRRLRASFSRVVTEAWTAVVSVSLVSAITLFLWESPWALLVPAWLVSTILVLYGPALAAGVMELLSPLRLRAATWAADRERHRREDPENITFPYYGRVWRPPAGSDGEVEQLCLQYFYFYAFNDWRHQQGFNYHEGDWEAALIFLERNSAGDLPATERWRPTKMALSRHHRGESRPWSETTRIARGTREHPVLFVAAGSHALYFEPGTSNLPDLVPGGLRRRILAGWHNFRENSLRSSEEGRETAQGVLGRPVAEQQARDDGTSDRANGRGLVIGQVLPGSAAPDQPLADWTPVVLDETASQTRWIDFPGRWGQRSLLSEESGPPGPKWDRLGEVDLLWSDPNAWAETLDTHT